MSKDTFSIFLEIASFFLVTTDLYGTEKISALQKKLRDMLRNFKFRSMLNPVEGVKNVGHDIGATFTIALLFCIIYFASIYKPISIPVEEFMDGISRWLWPFIVIPVLMVLVYICTFIILTPVYFYYSAIYLIQLVLLNVVNIIRLKNLDGLLITSGAMLFILSKIILML